MPKKKKKTVSKRRQPKRKRILVVLCVLAVLILEMLEMGNTTDGIVETHFQVGFWTAIGAVVMLSILGVLAGLAPAARAMSIKPVDAMRDE